LIYNAGYLNIPRLTCRSWHSGPTCHMKNMVIHKLPFYGVYLLDTPTPRICLVSPWMERGNLHDYLDEFRQKSRLPFVSSLLHSTDNSSPISQISDVANGLAYLHGLQIVHSDLKAVGFCVPGLQCDFLTIFLHSKMSSCLRMNGR
jgi:serine/threonine protein kinase